MNFTDKKCVPCEGSMPPFTAKQIAGYQPHISDEWAIISNARLCRQFKFEDFKIAMIFVNKVADLAESEGHHPDIKISWNKVTIELTTHAIKGLSENDFIIAAKIEKL